MLDLDCGFFMGKHDWMEKYNTKSPNEYQEVYSFLLIYRNM